MAETSQRWFGLLQLFQLVTSWCQVRVSCYQKASKINRARKISYEIFRHEKYRIRFSMAKNSMAFQLTNIYIIPWLCLDNC